jgi:hypothetical protein
MSDNNKTPEKATAKPNQKEAAKAILKSGIDSEKKALELFKAMKVAPRADYKGQPVKALFCTPDGQFFYTMEAAKMHAYKQALTGDIFTVPNK